MEHISFTLRGMKVKISELEKKVNIAEAEKVTAQSKCSHLEQQNKLN